MNTRIRELLEQATSYADTLNIADQKIYQKIRNMEFAELIVKECMTQCERVAVDADAMTKSKFVTDAGRTLHEGMWGGAKNCTAQIREHFGVEE